MSGPMTEAGIIFDCLLLYGKQDAEPGYPIDWRWLHLLHDVGIMNKSSNVQSLLHIDKPLLPLVVATAVVRRYCLPREHTSLL
jgi:hypothetical protein